MFQNPCPVVTFIDKDYWEPRWVGLYIGSTRTKEKTDSQKRIFSYRWKSFKNIISNKYLRDKKWVINEDKPESVGLSEARRRAVGVRLREAHLLQAVLSATGKVSDHPDGIHIKKEEVQRNHAIGVTYFVKKSGLYSKWKAEWNTYRR